MRPHPDNLYRLQIIVNLIDKAMLYVDSPGTCSGEVSHEFLKRRRILVRVFAKDVEQTRDSGFEP
jgi:hypothetical protein